MKDDEPRTDYTIDELRAADHERLAAYALAIQDALKVAREIAEKGFANSRLHWGRDL